MPNAHVRKYCGGGITTCYELLFSRSAFNVDATASSTGKPTDYQHRLLMNRQTLLV
jgi:hypothetical protein